MGFSGKRWRKRGSDVGVFRASVRSGWSLKASGFCHSQCVLLHKHARIKSVLFVSCLDWKHLLLFVLLENSGYKSSAS